MKELTPSRELAAIVGTQPLPRTEVTKRIWDYIKTRNLQNPANKRLLEDGALTLAREAASVPEACCELSAPSLPFTNTGSRPEAAVRG